MRREHGRTNSIFRVQVRVLVRVRVMPTDQPVHDGGALGAGQGVSAFFASQVMDEAPPCLNPGLHLNVALLPCLLPSLKYTSPLAGMMA